MRQQILIFIGLFTTTLFCEAQQLTSHKDSVAYSIGVDLASSVKQFDPTLDISIIVKALQDEFADKSILTQKQAMEALDRYVQEKRQAQFDEQFGKIEVESEKFLAEMAAQDGVIKSPTGLLYKIENMGGNTLPQDGDVVTVHYTLKLPDGTVIDSSLDRGEPFTYSNTEGAIIDGFREGIQLLGEGGKVTLYVPSSLGYGKQGSGSIMPNQALVFEIKLLAITPKK